MKMTQEEFKATYASTVEVIEAAYTAGEQNCTREGEAYNCSQEEFADKYNYTCWAAGDYNNQEEVY